MKGPQPKKELKPLTKEEKLNEVARFFAQKREQFATGIMFNAVNATGLPANKVEAEDLAIRAVGLADALIKELYPIPEDKPAE